MKCCGFTKRGDCKNNAQAGEIMCGPHLFQARNRVSVEKFKTIRLMACYLCSSLKACNGVLLEDGSAAWVCEDCFSDTFIVMKGFPQSYHSE